MTNIKTNLKNLKNQKLNWKDVLIVIAIMMAPILINEFIFQFHQFPASIISGSVTFILFWVYISLRWGNKNTSSTP